jgi:hypothetical protein
LDSFSVISKYNLVHMAKICFFTTYAVFHEYLFVCLFVFLYLGWARTSDLSFVGTPLQMGSCMRQLIFLLSFSFFLFFFFFFYLWRRSNLFFFPSNLSLLIPLQLFLPSSFFSFPLFFFFTFYLPTGCTSNPSSIVSFFLSSFFFTSD